MSEFSSGGVLLCRWYCNRCIGYPIKYETS